MDRRCPRAVMTSPFFHYPFTQITDIQPSVNVCYFPPCTSATLYCEPPSFQCFHSSGRARVSLPKPTIVLPSSAFPAACARILLQVLKSAPLAVQLQHAHRTAPFYQLRTVILNCSGKPAVILETRELKAATVEQAKAEADRYSRRSKRQSLPHGLEIIDGLGIKKDHQKSKGKRGRSRPRGLGSLFAIPPRGARSRLVRA